MSKQKAKQEDGNLSMDITKFIFLRDNLLIKAMRPKGANGLVDPAQYEDKPEFGVIISIGTGVLELKAGDVVRFGKYSSEVIRTNGEDYFIVREEDVSGYAPRTS